MITYGKPKQLHPDYSVKDGLDKLQLERANSEVDLGVTFDSGLDFEQHKNQKVNKATAILAVIRLSY